MTILVTPLTELHLVTAEEEAGTRLVKSLRTFLLNNRFIVIDDDLELTDYQIVPRSVLERNYQLGDMAPGNMAFATRI